MKIDIVTNRREWSASPAGSEELRFAKGHF